MNDLEAAEMSIGEPVSNFELFKFIGENSAKSDVEYSSQSFGKEPDDLKTTSVRMSEKKLLVLDAVMSQFGVNRTDAFSYAVTQIIVDAVIGYSVGYADYFDGDEQSAIDKCEAFIQSLPLDDDLKSYVKNMVHNELVIHLGLK